MNDREQRDYNEVVYGVRMTDKEMKAASSPTTPILLLIILILLGWIGVLTP